MKNRGYIFNFIIISLLLSRIFGGVLTVSSESKNPGRTGSSNLYKKNKTGMPDSAMSDSSGVLKRNEMVFLVHGVFKTNHDMRSLKEYLLSRGYHVTVPVLPTFFGSLEECTVKFEREFCAVSGDYDRIHFVGHSLGGLIIRLFLSRNRVPGIGRCVLIGTPNKGTELSAMEARYYKPIKGIFKPLQAFQPGGVEIPPPLNSPAPEMGAIAGNRNSLFLGRFIDGENDGRVPVKSVPFEGMKEFVVLPYHHMEIHHRREVAELVQTFLQKGTFGINTRQQE